MHLAADAGENPPSIWVVLPTYNEAANLENVAAAVLAHLPSARVLVVDDSSPDGTGDLADQLAARHERIAVLHRAEKNGLGRAYLDGFRTVLAAGADVIVQMDADFSHEPATLPALIAPIVNGSADMVIGSRYTSGGRTVGWPIGRRLISRAGSIFARLVLSVPVRDLTGGFKAWSSTALSAIAFDGIRAGGYVFQIEMTHRAHRMGVRIVEVPITFRDRTAGVSKMSRRIVLEAFALVVALRVDELLGRSTASPPPLSAADNAGVGEVGAR